MAFLPSVRTKDQSLLVLLQHPHQLPHGDIPVGHQLQDQDLAGLLGTSATEVSRLSQIQKCLGNGCISYEQPAGNDQAVQNGSGGICLPAVVP